jgi:hypothetical protein
MADNKSGRDEQAHRVDERQRERALAEELERGEEPEPPADADSLDAVETALDELSFPATAAAVVSVAGELPVTAAPAEATIGGASDGETGVDEGTDGHAETETDDGTAAADGEGTADDERTARVATYTVAELLPESERLQFPAPEAVRAHVRRPTVAGAIKRIVEAGDDLDGAVFGRSQRDAYRRTFRALAALDTTDDDEPVGTVTDWAVERIETTGSYPPSRRLRKEAAAVCRRNGYEIRDDEWLGA